MDRVPRLERTALVVDDDMYVQSALAELLDEGGYDVHCASNGFSAVRLAIECRPLVVLLDLVLPERSGADVLAELRGDPATRDTAIVVVTGNAHLLTEAQLAETDGLVSKPFDVDEVMTTVQRAVRRALLRHAEVAPVASAARGTLPVRPGRASGVRHSRGRR
jgi:two-component system response regulator AtoC